MRNNEKKRIKKYDKKKKITNYPSSLWINESNNIKNRLIT